MIPILFLFTDHALLFLRTVCAGLIIAQALRGTAAESESGGDRLLSSAGRVIRGAGGLFLFAGLLTQPAALMLAAMALFSLATSRMAPERERGEMGLHVLLFAALLLLAVGGGGNISVDAWLGIAFY